MLLTLRGCSVVRMAVWSCIKTGRCLCDYRGEYEVNCWRIVGYQTVSLKQVFIFTIEVFCATLWASLGALVVKNRPANAGDRRDSGSIPGSGRFPGGGHGNPLQYSCLENPLDRGAWRATVHGVAQSGTPPKRLRTHAHGALNCCMCFPKSCTPIVP